MLILPRKKKYLFLENGYSYQHVYDIQDIPIA